MLNGQCVAMPDDFDRSFVGYLRTLWSGPGFAVRVAAGVVFAVALFLEKGARTLAIVVVGVRVLAVVLIYPLYRRRGPGPL